MSVPTTNLKKTDFNRVLENGFDQQITKVLLNIYDIYEPGAQTDLPANPMEIIMKNLGVPSSNEIEELEAKAAENKEIKKIIVDLEDQVS